MAFRGRFADSGWLLIVRVFGEFICLMVTDLCGSNAGERGADLLLRRRIQPYVGAALGCALGIFALAFISIITSSWSPLLRSGWIFLLLFGAWVFIGMRYRISFSDAEIVMQASGLRPVAIRYEEMVSVESEASIDRGRPFRRIAIYSQGKGHGKKRIDVSLKHFASGDIQALLEKIHEERPDLRLPKIGGV